MSGRFVLVVDSLGLRERKKLDTWRAIRAAAVDLFLDRGYEAVSVDDIAAAANVSPSTFFNYFTAKEAVVFDPDPADLSTRSALLAARPAGEPLWASLREVLLGYMAAIGESAVVRKRVMAASSTLARSRRDTTDRIHDELLEWATARDCGLSERERALSVNIAMAAVVTAYASWEADEGVARLTDLARACLDRAGAGMEPTTLA
jgi:AcrR family transcriptional regulator